VWSDGGRRKWLTGNLILLLNGPALVASAGRAEGFICGCYEDDGEEREEEGGGGADVPPSEDDA
jgi:hypothetical protein